jgi:hypothetical protein
MGYVSCGVVKAFGVRDFRAEMVFRIYSQKLLVSEDNSGATPFNNAVVWVNEDVRIFA